MSTVSAAKIRANRRNARKSTGPASEQGKAIASRNAMTFGLFCRDMVLPGESLEDFRLLRDGLIESFAPVSVAEFMLLDRIVSAQWKLRRIQKSEADLHLSLLHQHRNSLEDRIEIERRNEEHHRRVRNGGIDPLAQQNRAIAEAEHAGPTPLELAQERLLRFDSGEDLDIGSSELYRIQDKPSVRPSTPDQMLHLARQEQRLEGTLFRATRELQRMQQLRMQLEEKTREEEQEDDTNEIEPTDAPVDEAKMKIEPTAEEPQVNPRREQELPHPPSPGTPGEGRGEGSLTVQTNDSNVSAVPVTTKIEPAGHSSASRTD